MSNDQWPNHSIKPEAVTQPSNQQPLKPCPFCGYKTPHVVKVCNEKTSEFCWSVICAGCSCDTKHCLSPSEAEELWNTRSTPTPPREVKKWTSEDVRQLVIYFSLVAIDEPMFEKIAEWMNERSK